MTSHSGAEPLLGSVEYWAHKTPAAPALSDGTRKLDYAQWNDHANRLAELLVTRAQVAAGDHVALCMQNRLEWFITQAAVAKLGAILVPISFRLTPSEIHYIAADSGAVAFAFDTQAVETLASVWTDEPKVERTSRVRFAIGLTRDGRSELATFAELSLDNTPPPRFAQRIPRSIVYTSGTTGRPRGVVHAHYKPKPSHHDAAEPKRTTRADTLAAIAPDIRRNLLGAPLNHAAGQASALATHSVGGCVYVLPRFDAREALRIMHEERITTSFLVPTMLNRILNLPSTVLAAHDVSAIRRITTGAAPCPQAIKEQVFAYFGPHCLYESYGTTEVGIVARMQPEDHARKPGACGRLVEGVDVQIRDTEGHNLVLGEVGEIFVRTPFMIERYLNEAPARELVDGYFATGDVGRFDADGFLYVVDRKKDMIIAGGVNIYPAEIEDALRKHPAVLDAAAFGVPDPDLGEQVRAVVECVETQTVTEAELLSFLADHLAAYKRPRAIAIVLEIPRNPAGKVLKRQLREPYWQHTGKQI
ncbi:MAG: hypothetical protein RL701_2837 [Pseudomonadota bacterium]